MKPQLRVIAAGCIIVVSFDLVASLAARRFGFPYDRASIGSYFIYLLIGFVAGRGALGDRAKVGALSAAVAGVADASIGWAVSWAIGPGRPPSGTLSPGEWIVAAAVVVAFAAAIGYIGGVLGARSRPSAPLTA
jgi:hypothetical protein